MSSVCPSVCLSVTLVDCDHIGWNFAKIISLLVSVGRSFSADPDIIGSNRKFGPKVTIHVTIHVNSAIPVDLNVGDIRSQTAAE